MNRNQKILAVVAALIIALYITGVSTQQGSGDGSDPTQHPFIKAIGGWFAKPDAVKPEELSGQCLAGDKLTIENKCVLAVNPSDKDVRELYLKSDFAFQLMARAPHDDSSLDKSVAAGEEIKVAVDDKGVDITLVCGKCTVVVGG